MSNRGETMNEKKGKSHTIEHSPVPMQNHIKMIHNIAEIERHFRQGTLVYTEGIGRFNVEIEKFKNLIISAEKSKEDDEQALLALEGEIHYDEKMLTRLNEQFTLKVRSIQELKNEYQTLVDKHEYEKMYQRKKYEMQEILDELEALEMTLLSRELQRLNLLLKLDPIRKSLEELKKDLKEVELEKGHFESTQLQQITLTQKTKQIPQIEEIVDTEILKDDI